MRSTRLVVSVVICLLLLSTRTIFAQAALDCVTLVQQSLSDFGNSCRNLGTNSLCYGHLLVTAQTNSSNSGSFVKPADQLALSSVESVAGSAADLNSGNWGLAMANMTPTDGTAPVQMMLMGNANIALAPTTPTGLQIGTSFGNQPCAEAPSLVAIETAENISVPLTINGITSQSTSLVIFQQESANAIKAIVYSGSFAVSGGATAQAGQTLAGVMDNKGVILFWSAPRPSNDTEAKAASVVVNAFTNLGIVQPTPIPPPSTPTPVPPTAEPVTEGCGQNVTHVVQPGENLYRISLRYGTSIGTIQKANNISDPNQIVVGQTLVIPCGNDSGTSSVAPENNNNAQPTAAPSDDATPAPDSPTAQSFDCSNLPPDTPPIFQQFCSH